LSLKNASPSFHLPPNKRSSRRHKTSKDKLDTEIFEMCMEYVLHFSFFFVTLYFTSICCSYYFLLQLYV
jgi:hypothetical protein